MKNQNNIIMESIPEKCEYGNMELDHIDYDEETNIVHAYFIRPIKSSYKISEVFYVICL